MCKNRTCLIHIAFSVGSKERVDDIRWGERGARLNDIAPGIIVTPLQP